MNIPLNGPSLVVHILIATLLNALLFPFLYAWTGAVLYAFLVSVAILCGYGAVVLWIASRWRR
jgi:hypothetical protein